MSDLVSKIREKAAEACAEDVFPNSQLIAEALDCDVDVVEQTLVAWVKAHDQSNDAPTESSKVRATPPEILLQQMNQLWEAALDEASAVFKDELSTNRVTDDEERQSASDMVRVAEGRYQDLERRYRDKTHALEQQVQSVRALEAEINVLKATLATETNLRKKQEQLRANADSELSQLRKQLEDSKKLFDQRIKDEQRQALEAVARAEVDTRHYRNALDKMRDDSGRVEAELTRSVHELQGQVARKDARIDMQDASLKDLESEHEELKQSLTSFSREIAALNSRLLKENNANRRYETQVKEQEEEIRRLNQRLVLNSNESSKRENSLRQQLKERDDQLKRSSARINSLEKRLTSQEDQIRRLNARL